MFGIDATQKLRQNRRLARHVLDRNYQTTRKKPVERHYKESHADPKVLEEIRNTTRRTNRKDMLVSILIAIALLGIMISLFMYMVNR